MKLRGTSLGLVLILMFVLGLIGGGVAGGATAFWLARANNGETAAIDIMQSAVDETPPATVEMVPSLTPLPPTETVPPTATPEPSPTAEPPPTAEASGEEMPAVPDVATMVEQVGPATVQVLTNLGSGSGVIISEEGFIVTNAHVVENSSRFAIVFQRGERSEASLVGIAPDYDIAVLRISGAVPGVAAWGDSSALRLGETVIAIGSALGSYQNTVTSGILGGVNRTIDPLTGLIQHDAAINPGNSGGPLLNARGEVVGINTAVVRGGLNTQAEGLGFAVPSNVAAAVARQLIETGEARRPYMGVYFTDINSQIVSQEGLPVSSGAYLSEIIPNTPSAAAGLQSGDVVLAINEAPVTDANPLNVQLLTYQPGDTITLTVLRGEDQLSIAVTLGG